MTDATADIDRQDTTPDGWHEALSEDLRGHAALEKFEDVDALAREHMHLQKLIGRKGIVPPGEDANEDEIGRFYDSLGRPKSPDGYELGDLARPEGMPWDEALETQMLAHMHAAGLTNAQARSILEGYVEVQGAAWEEARGIQGRTLDAAEDELRREWGGTFDAKIDVANRAFAAAFGDKVDDIQNLQLADGRFLGDHPDIVRAFASIGGLFAEAEFVGPKEGRMGQSAEEARTKLSALEADPDFRSALLDRAHPEHRQALARRSDLTRIAFDAGDGPDGG